MKNWTSLLGISVFKSVLFSFFLLSSQLAHTSQSDLDAELKNYIDLFTSDDFANQRKAMDPLGWAGISDPALYDVIESKLLNLYQNDDKISQEHAAWYAKTLALSGNSKYQTTLNKVIDTGSKKVAKHAKTALERFANHESWNPIISSNLTSAPNGKLEQARVNNMLSSGQPLLVTIGAKRVYYAHSDDDALVKVVSQVLQQEYQSASTDEQIDQIAWLIKTLAQSGDSSYKPLLEKIADDATERKIAKYAKKYKDYL